MKKILLLMLIMNYIALHSLFKEVQDHTSQNNFLGQNIKSCSVQDYKCGNSTISDVLNLDFFSHAMLGRQVYLFNDFIYWIGAQYKAEEYAQTALKYSGKRLEDKMNQDFPAPGTYMIVLGTSMYLKKIIASDKICPQGQYPLMAQLQYNDGNLIYSWSQDSICLAPGDAFSLQISSELDTTISSSSSNQSKNSVDEQGIDWMKNPGPNATYQQAQKSPRKVKLVKVNS